MDEAERCDHLAYIYLSKLLVNGSPGELKRLPHVNPEGTRRIEARTARIQDALRRVEAYRGVREATVFGESIRMLVEDATTGTLSYPALIRAALTSLSPSAAQADSTRRAHRRSRATRLRHGAPAIASGSATSSAPNVSPRSSMTRDAGGAGAGQDKENGS